MPVDRATIKSWPRCGCTCARRHSPCMPGPSRWRRRSTPWRPARARSCCPATPICSRPCRVRWRCGPQALLPRFTTTQEPVTAVQISRGKAEAQLLFEITLLTQDLGRLASDLLLFYTQEFGFVSLPPGFTTGSSIMPQKRNPDVFELMRGRSAVAQSALTEVLNITQKLPSGYHRDLQLIKPPLFRGIDSCLQTLDILPGALAGVRFNPQNIRLDPGIHAAAAANALVTKDNVPFREAYRQLAAKLKDPP